MELNVALSAKLADFAKANKVSKAKLEALAIELLNSVEAKQVVVGRKASSDTVELRERLLKFVAEANVPSFTSVEVAACLNVDVVVVNNALNFFEKLNKFRKAGLAAKEEGKRGRRQVIWQVV